MGHNILSRILCILLKVVDLLQNQRPLRQTATRTVFLVLEINQMNIRHILRLIASMKTIPALAGHASSLEGPRTRGSTTEFGLDILDPETEFEDFTPMPSDAAPGCKYYRCQAPSLKGKMGAIPIGSLLSDNLLSLVRVRKGVHGYELYMDTPQAEAMNCESNTLTVILGPDETGALPEIVWTWHPGKILGRCQITDSTAIKTHNG